MSKSELDGVCKELGRSSIEPGSCPVGMQFGGVLFSCQKIPGNGHETHQEEGENTDGSFYRMTWDRGTGGQAGE